MLTHIFISASFVAMASLIWKETVNTFPQLKNGIKRILKNPLARKPLFCGFCFTGWVAFFTTIVAAPAPELNFFMAWFALAAVALIIRNVIIALDELVHWEVHTLNQQPDDLH